MSASSNLKPRLVVPIGHTNTITSVAFSPDGRYRLTGSMDQTAKLWDAEGRELATFSEQNFLVYALAFSPEGDRIVIGSADKTCKVWNVYTGEIELQLEGHEKSVDAVAFSPDGQRILTGSADNTLGIWDAQSGELLARLEGHESRIRAVAWSPDGEHLLSGSDDGQLKGWSVEKEAPVFEIEDSSKAVYGLAFSPDSRRFISASQDGKARIRTAGRGKSAAELNSHKKAVRAVAWSPDGKHLLTGSDDNTAVLWSDKGEKLLTFKEHRGNVRAVAFSPDSRLALTGSRDETAICWVVESGETKEILQGHGKAITDVAFSAEERLILSGMDDHRATVWDVATCKTKRLLEGHSKAVSAVAFSPDDRLIFTGGEDNQALLWDSQDKPRHVLAGHAKSVKAGVFSPDGTQIATASMDKTVRVWETASGKEILTLKGHKGAVNTVAFSPSGQQLVTGSSDNQAWIWELPAGKVLKKLEGHEDTVRAVAYDPQGKRIATASYDNTARLWDATTGEHLLTLEGHEYDVRAVTFSPDGRRVLTGAYDETARLWDAATGECLLTLTGHDSCPRSVAFSPDGNHLFTGSRDNMIKIWDSYRGIEMASLIQIGAEDWVVTTPRGLFDASPRAMELMHYVVNYRGKSDTEWVVLELEQLKERYYEPGLLPKLLGYQPGDIREVGKFDLVHLFPGLEARIESDLLKVKLKERNGGIGKTGLFINGKEVLEDADPKRQSTFTVRLDEFDKYYRLDSPNQITLRTYNEEGWLKSHAHTLLYLPVTGRKGAGRRRTGKRWEQAVVQHLHAIVVGTSHYRATGIHSLTYPDKDAADMANALRAAGSMLFEDRLNIHLLTSAAEVPAAVATKENIREAFKQVAAQAKPHDVLVIYFSGHGANFGGGQKGQFYYLTRDLTSDNLHDPAIRYSGAISSREFTEWINAIPAGKQVLILDTCHSGKIIDSLGGSRAADDTIKIRALDRMKDRTGMFVLAGSGADHFSYEASRYGQGLLTYCLLLGMTGPGLKEDVVDVSQLFQFARDEVPRVAEEVMTLQEPVLAMPRGGDSFSLGLVDESIGDKIKVASPKKIIITSIFQDKDDFGDTLNLSGHLDRYFRKFNAEGREASVIFVPIHKMNGACFVRGLYSRKKKKISVEGRVFEMDKAIGKFKVEGNLEDIPGLAEQMAAAVVGLLETHSKL